jgi:acyl carrier protein
MSDVSTSRPISRTEITQRVRGVLAEQFGLKPTDTPTRESFAGFDEVDLLKAVVAIEKSFGVELDLIDAANAALDGTLISMIEGQIRKAERRENIA